MVMNRVQFQSGLSLPHFMELYGTEEKCEAALELMRWPRKQLLKFQGLQVLADKRFTAKDS